MILLKTRRRRIMQRDHMSRPLRDVKLARLRLRKQRTGHCLRTARRIAAYGVETEDVVAVTRDDKHRRRRQQSFSQPGPYAQQLAHPDDILIIDIHVENHPVEINLVEPITITDINTSPEIVLAAGCG